MTVRFVTGAGTEIGKTFVAASLCAQLRARGRAAAALKPVLSGYDEADATASDPAVLLRALGQPAGPDAIARIAPWRFAAPLSPDMAARREGRRVEFDALVAFCRAAMAEPHDDLLIEGVGGAMVPLDDRRTVRDWIAALGVPALVVAGGYLGAISHALTAVATLREAGIAIDAVIVNESASEAPPLEETAETIARFAGARVVTLRRQPGRAAWNPDPAALLDRLSWPA